MKVSMLLINIVTLFQRGPPGIMGPPGNPGYPGKILKNDKDE